MKRVALTIAAALLLGTQSYGQMAAGRLVRMSDFAITDMAQFSQYDYTLGTARSAAMGGAFVSLGADLSSMALNPAGLGMYRSSEFGLTPSLTWSKTDDRFLDGPYVTNSAEQNATRFALGNVGLALNLYQSTGSLTSVTVGFGYQKLADFNYRSSVGSNGWEISINDVFAHQLRGISSAHLSTENGRNPWNDPALAPNMWGAAAAWQTWAVDGNVDYTANLLPGALTDNMLINRTRGSLGEFDISVGMNFSNRLYLGFTMGIQDLYYRQELLYEEHYDQPYYGDDARLRYMQYDQQLAYNGTGVNFKAGMIYRPIEALRIGVAVHSPTLMTLDREYRIKNFYTEMQDDFNYESWSDYLAWRYEYASPTRLMAGVSYQLGQFALLAADYERVWYNGMRLQESDEYYLPQSERDAIKQDVKYSFRGTDNLRLGMEIKPTPQLALRLGYTMSSSPISGRDNVAPSSQSAISTIDNPIITSSHSLSGGIGYRWGGFSLDAAYVQTHYDVSNYAMFWYHEGSYGGAPTYLSSGTVASSMTRGLATLTLGFRF